MSEQDAEERLQLDDETKRLIHAYGVRTSVTQWDVEPDYASHYAHLLPDDPTESERRLWENADGMAKKYAALSIRDWRKVEETGEYRHTPMPK